MTDKEVIKEYPFLEVKDAKGKHTGICVLGGPSGWRGLGLLLAKHIKELLTDEELKTYEVTDVKEKYGQLRWYDTNAKTEDLIWAFEELSEHVCIKCGKLNTPMTNIGSWLSPICEDCYKKLGLAKPYKDTIVADSADFPETIKIHCESASKKEDYDIDLKPFIRELEELA